MSLKTTSLDKLTSWLAGFWASFRGDVAHGFNAFLELSKPIVAGLGPETWIVLNHAFAKALSDVKRLDFSDVVPDVLTILAREGLEEGVHFVSAELEALLTLLTKGGTVNPHTAGTLAQLTLKPPA